MPRLQPEKATRGGSSAPTSNESRAIGLSLQYHPTRSEERYPLTQNPAALATARRNVVQRITRFIEALEQAPREPDPWEGEHI